MCVCCVCGWVCVCIVCEVGCVATHVHEESMYWVSFYSMAIFNEIFLSLVLRLSHPLCLEANSGLDSWK